MKVKLLILVLLINVICLVTAQKSKNSLALAIKIALTQCQREVNYKTCGRFARRINVLSQESAGNYNANKINGEYVNKLNQDRTLIQRFIDNVNDPDLLGVMLQDNFPTLNRNPSSSESEHIRSLRSNAALLKQLIVIIFVHL